MKNKNSAFVGYLSSYCPLKSVFLDGRVPLHSPTAETVVLEGQPLPEKCYMLELSECTPEEREAIAVMMHEADRGPIVETRRAVAVMKTLPVRERNITSVSFPLRYIV